MKDAPYSSLFPSWMFKGAAVQTQPLSVLGFTSRGPVADLGHDRARIPGRLRHAGLVDLAVDRAVAVDAVALSVSGDCSTQ